MSHGPEHHLEEAEHAQHATQDPFTRQVAMTMAIGAATLACVSLLSHRAHNDNMAHQLKANDMWNWFQVKKDRGYTKQDRAVLLAAISSTAATPSEKWATTLKEWRDKAQQYADDSKSNEEKAKEEERLAEEAHHRSNFYDWGELGLQLGLVLSSVAVLTKRSLFWFAGIGVSVVGVALAAYGFLMLH
jgi:hypothetical protein